MPPTRRSLLWVVVLKPRGPHHCAAWAGSVQASQTTCRGASYTRTRRISLGALNSDIFISLRWFFCGDGFQVGIEAVETLFPEHPGLLPPVGGVLQSL